MCGNDGIDLCLDRCAIIDVEDRTTAAFIFSQCRLDSLCTSGAGRCTHDGSALCGEVGGNGRADAARCACDEGNLPRQGA